MKKGLEEKIKEKVSSLLEESMEKHWGLSIPQLGSDLTDKVQPGLDLYIPPNLTFSSAKKFFRGEFLKRELRLHRGNISQLAKTLGLDRRSIHRAIKSLEIDVQKLKSHENPQEKYTENLVDQKIRETLDQYKEIIQPQKMEKLYEEVPTLSRNIAKVLPVQEWSWKEAEEEFEKQFFLQALEENQWVVKKTAEKLKLRPETLHRKIKKLGLKEL